ncbi:putative RNA binding protein YcfA (HicA-like mRNA interferase family) [Microbacterium resistens]|uniref:RNA binding protein YcfA (HicA-like mRNA interferase family) n=1 Tax=Microbacterium resistens TaxID=156977 RepID=A0ABU1SFU0_9MICO|nr:type II toxin-antitoxin system HicA family toxin [Microbacterium resistens]MDR6868465.1 putative RNA binding protein YcfA (HicA-like mRNA interferase family) [Microbacterium resistens]
MVSEQPTRKVVRLLKDAGWSPIRTAGSHTTWASPTGATFTLPDGHRTISPGVYRKLLKALEEESK